MGKFSRSFVLLGAAIWALSLAQAAPLPGRLVEMLGDQLGRELLVETPAGRALVARVLGHPIAAADGRLLTGEFGTRLEKPGFERLSDDLAARLADAEAELHAQLQGRGALSRDARLRLVEETSARWFKLRDVAVGGPIEFADATPHDRGAGGGGLGGYEAERGGFPGAGPLSPLTRGATLETAIPVEAGSIDARLGHAYADLLALEQKYFTNKGLHSTLAISQAVGAGGRPATLGEMLGYIAEQRQAMADELMSMAGQVRAKDPLYAESLEKAAHEVGLSSSSREKIAEKRLTLDGLAYAEHGGEAEPLMDYVHKLRGELGELKIAVRVQGLVGRGLKVQDIGRFMGEGHLGDAARARLEQMAHEFPSEIGKELDLILGEGFLWGEVKNYSEVFGREHRFYEKVMEQARHTVQIRDLLERDPAIAAALKALGGKHIRFRIYLGNGVTDGAARDLEDLGFEVFGPRYLDAAYLDWAWAA